MHKLYYKHVLRPANINLLPEPQTNIKITGRTDVVENLIRYYKDNKTAVVACIGEAGLGKSQIVREFLTSFNNDDISQNDQPNLKAQWIYCWSFLNNSKDYLEESSTEFFDSILKFYGFENYPYSEEQQAELLVNLIKTEESLLILHGLDPLLEDQPKNEGLRKRIQDKEKELDKILKKNKNLGKSGEKMDEQLQNKQEKVKLQNELKVIKELNTLISSYKNPNNVVVVKDRPMRIFLRKLCDETKEMGNYHKGLVIITARNAISDLNPYYENHIYRKIILKPLDDTDCEKILSRCK